MSKTFIMISDVPDLDGVPPSTAVRSSFIKACFSRSSDFCRTSSADTVSPLSPGKTLSAMSIVCDLALKDGGLSLTSSIFTSIR
uniref:Uncharacterized protein n=1 Tax=Labrus bergylta TaxID=56723 RepID=A0A3Q3E9D3_9LABR